ncbi:hypothetical protein Tco_0970667 [Tanacetum coccineum]
MSTMNMTQHLKSQGGSSSRSKTPRPSKPPPSLHGSYDHDTHGYNRVISLRRGIKPRNPQHVTKSCETCGSTVHTTYHNDIEWLRRGEALQAKKAEAFQSKHQMLQDLRLLLKDSGCSRHMTGVKSYLHKYVEQPGPKVVFEDDSTYTTEGYGSIESVFSKQYWTEAVATACYTQNRSTIFKIHLKTPYEIFRGRIPNIDFLHVFGCPVYIHNHKDYLGKFDKKKLMMVISLDTHLFPKPSESSTPEDNKLKKPITLHLMKALMLSNSQNLQMTISPLLNLKDTHLMKPYERPEPAVIDTDGSYNQNDQADQNDHSTQDNEILNDDQSKHSNHNNDKHIIENIIITKDVQNPKLLSSPAEDALVSNTILILINPSLSILSMASPAPQDKWSQDKHIKLVNIIGNTGARMLTRAMAKELSAASAHECLFVNFLSE